MNNEPEIRLSQNGNDMLIDINRIPVICLGDVYIIERTEQVNDKPVYRILVGGAALLTFLIHSEEKSWNYFPVTFVSLLLPALVFFLYRRFLAEPPKVRYDIYSGGCPAYRASSKEEAMNVKVRLERAIRELKTKPF